MSNQLDICNLALFKLGHSTRIATLAENSLEANTFNALWEQTLAFVQTDGIWPFLLRTEALAPSADDPPPGWRFRYSRPNTCLTAWALANEDSLRAFRLLQVWCQPEWRWATFGSLFDWQTVYGSSETEIVTDVEDAWLVYTSSEDNTSRFPPKFVEALACRLAFDAAGPIIGQMGLNNRGALLQEYQLARNDAATHDYNEAVDTGMADALAVQARG